MLGMADDFELVFCHYEHNSEFGAYQEAEELILPRNPIAASRALRAAGLDLVHYNPLTIYSPLFVGRRGRKGRGAAPAERDRRSGSGVTRRVATIHGAAPLFLPDQYSHRHVLHERHVVKALGRRMDHLFAVSKATKRFMVETYQIPADRIDVIYNAVDPSFRRLSTDRLDRSRFAELTPFVFHLSKFSERKNPWTILEAFTTLSGIHPELSLVLAGSGWQNPTVERYLEERNIADRVIFSGFLVKEEIVELMNLAEVFVFPSLYEGFGMPNLEAMACGCPVVTSNAFAIPEVVGDAAITLADPRDSAALTEAISRIRGNPELAADLSERGAARARSFSWEHSVETILGAYRRLLGMM